MKMTHNFKLCDEGTNVFSVLIYCIIQTGSQGMTSASCVYATHQALFLPSHELYLDIS